MVCVKFSLFSIITQATASCMSAQKKCLSNEYIDSTELTLHSWRVSILWWEVEPA